MYICTIEGELLEMEYTAKDLERVILQDGWYFVKQKDSHRQYKHPSKPGKVTIPFHKPDSLHPKTAISILKQAGFKQFSLARKETHHETYISCYIHAFW